MLVCFVNTDPFQRTYVHKYNKAYHRCDKNAKADPQIAYYSAYRFATGDYTI